MENNQNNQNKNQELNDYNNSIPGRRILESNNSILVIHVYYLNGLWVFDDARVGLTAEPFVGGADDFIDHLLKLKGIREEAVKKGFNAIFSKQEFRGADAQINFTCFANQGTVYTPVNVPDFRNKFGTHDLWLCPALNLYFKDSPEGIWVSVQL
jgi:hypothetical protein